MFARIFPRLLPLFALIAHIALWVMAATTLGRLDATTQPSTFGQGDFWVLPAVGLVLILSAILVVAGSRRLAVTHPGFVNVPRKRDWMRLPVASRLATLEPVASLVYGLAFFANLLFIAVVVDMHAVATGVLTEMPQSKALLAVIGLMAWIALSMLRMRQTDLEEVKRIQRSDVDALQSDGASGPSD